MEIYPDISHEAGLTAPRETLVTETKQLWLRKMAEFVKNFFEFNSKIKQLISGTVISTKF